MRIMMAVWMVTTRHPKVQLMILNYVLTFVSQKRNALLPLASTLVTLKTKETRKSCKPFAIYQRI